MARSPLVRGWAFGAGVLVLMSAAALMSSAPLAAAAQAGAGSQTDGTKAPRTRPSRTRPADPKPPDPPPATAKTELPKADAAKPPDARSAPRFASLRYDKVALRTGPSTDYPIQWIFVRKGLPVEVLAAFDIWRKIRDIDGTLGWVNQQQLNGARRSVLVVGSVRSLRHDPKPDGEIVAMLEPGVIAAISKCEAAWCELHAGGYRGWLKRDELWGLEPDEIIQ